MVERVNVYIFPFFLGGPLTMETNNVSLVENAETCRDSPTAIFTRTGRPKGANG